MTCFALANPGGLVSKYRLGNECEVWSETNFTMVTYAGTTAWSQPRTSCQRCTSQQLTLAILRPAPSIHRSNLRHRPVLFCTSPICTSISKGFRGCSEVPPGQVRATTNASPSISVTFFIGIHPVSERESRTSISVRTCGSATGHSPLMESQRCRPTAARHSCRRKQTLAFGTICSFEGSGHTRAESFNSASNILRT